MLDQARIAISASVRRQFRQYVVDQRWTLNRLGVLTARLLAAVDETQIYVNVQPLSGAVANLAVYDALMEPGDLFGEMGMLDDGPRSAMARALYRLGALLYRQDFTSRAEAMLQAMAPRITATPEPNFYANWCALYSELAYPFYEIAIVGPGYQPLVYPQGLPNPDECDPYGCHRGPGGSCCKRYHPRNNH